MVAVRWHSAEIFAVGVVALHTLEECALTFGSHLSS